MKSLTFRLALATAAAALVAAPALAQVLILVFLGRRTLLAAPWELRRVFDNTAT